jgi:DNA ligase-associated metallophosphoesterase
MKDDIRGRGHIITIRGQQLLLLPERVVLWMEARTLIVSDTHFGKPGHFRRSGIPIPGTLNDIDSHRLQSIVSETDVERVVITGDLFHSDINREWRSFSNILEAFPDVSFILIPGNHDILPPGIYEKAGLRLAERVMQDAPFTFVHSTEEEVAEEGNDEFFIGGHIHPMYRVSGRARQSARVPCFHLSERSLTLPSFGTFTGGHTIRPHRSDKVFLVVEDRVLDPISVE